MKIKIVAPLIYFVCLLSCGTMYAQQEICLVTADSTNTMNIIVWEKPNTTQIDSYKIYRDIAGTYTLIGSVSYDSLSIFMDNTNGVDPSSNAYKYKLSAVNTGGVESAMSTFHETVLLSVLVNWPAIDLTWTPYSGFAFGAYNIFRDTNNTGNWQVFDSVPSSFFTYTDPNPPSTNTMYRVEAVHLTGCVASKGKNFNSSKSNSVSADTVVAGIQTPIQAYDLVLFPNPVVNLLGLRLTLPKRQEIKLTIVNVLGEEVYTELFTQFEGVDQHTVYLGNYSRGIYYLQLSMNDGSVLSNKIILQ